MNKMGIGLGLYICKKIVNECGGDIYYDSDNLIGASFIFNIHCLSPERLEPDRIELVDASMIDVRIDEEDGR